MTQLITERVLRWAKALVAAQLVLTVVVAVLLAALVFGNLPRLQHSTDRNASAAAAAQLAAQSADRTLTSALAALSTPNPTTTYTRAQLDALCHELLGADCPPPPTTTTTTVEGR